MMTMKTLPENQTVMMIMRHSHLIKKSYRQTKERKTRLPSRQRCLPLLLLLRWPPSSTRSKSCAKDHQSSLSSSMCSESRSKDHKSSSTSSIWNLKPSSSTRFPLEPLPPILPAFILPRKNSIKGKTSIRACIHKAGCPQTYLGQLGQ